MNKEEFLKKIEVELKIAKYSNYTIRNYLQVNKEFLDIIKKDPEQITKEDVKLYLTEVPNKKSSSSGILALAAIKFAFEEILKTNPTAGIKRPKKEKKIPTTLTKEEVTKLIDSAKSKKSKSIIQLLYATGMRVSEIVNLKKKDLHLDESLGYIVQAKGKKDRMFVIPQFLKDELKKLKETSGEYLFEGKKGKLTTRNIQKIVKSAAKRAGIEKDVHPHTLRHSYATHLLENGTDVRVIQELLGHSNLDTTQIYTKISTQQLKKVVSPLDTLYQKRE